MKSYSLFCTQFLKTGLYSCLQPIAKLKQVFQIKGASVGQYSEGQNPSEHSQRTETAEQSVSATLGAKHSP